MTGGNRGDHFSVPSSNSICGERTPFHQAENHSTISPFADGFQDRTISRMHFTVSTISTSRGKIEKGDHSDYEDYDEYEDGSRDEMKTMKGRWS